MKSLDECIDEMEKIYDRYNCEGCFYCSFQRECSHRDCYVEDILQKLKEYRNLAVSLNPKRSTDEDIR